jgi:hypothetical protein
MNSLRAHYCVTWRTYGNKHRSISKRKLSRNQAAELDGQLVGEQLLRTYLCATCGSYHAVKQYIVPGVGIGASKRGGTNAMPDVRS